MVLSVHILGDLLALIFTIIIFCYVRGATTRPFRVLTAIYATGCGFAKRRKKRWSVQSQTNRYHFLLFFAKPFLALQNYLTQRANSLIDNCCVRLTQPRLISLIINNAINVRKHTLLPSYCCLAALPRSINGKYLFDGSNYLIAVLLLFICLTKIN